MDPGTIAAILGAATSIFGGRKASREPSSLRRNYRLANSILQRAIDLYDSANLEDLDRQAMAAYTRTAMDEAMQALSNYDARAAAQGSPILKDDTAKSRARAQIAADAGRRLGEIEANLVSTRPARQRALLPAVQDAAGLSNTAALLDQFRMQRAQSDEDSLLKAAALVAKLFGRKAAKSNINDVYGALAPGSVLDNSWANPSSYWG